MTDIETELAAALARVAELTGQVESARRFAQEQAAARRDEESWWKEKHDYQARAEKAEASLAAARAEIQEWKTVRAWAADQREQALKTELAAANARIAEMKNSHADRVGAMACQIDDLSKKLARLNSLAVDLTKASEQDLIREEKPREGGK